MSQPLRFGEVLRRFRERGGWSQAEVGRSAGFDHSYLSRCEAGTRFPSRDSVDRLAAAMDLEGEERDELLVAAGFTEMATPLPPELRELHAVWHGLDAQTLGDMRAGLRLLMAGALAGQEREIA